MKDVILVGAGLAGGLLADRLLAARPELDLLVLESGEAPGGNHTWSFHDTDVPASTLAWLRPFVSRSWKEHDVVFPSFARTLPGEYLSIRSTDFAARLGERLGARLRTRTRVREVGATGVTLEDGTELAARVVFDGRGFSDRDLGPVGFQKFVGQEVLLKAPHGLTRPLLMDASVPQLEGFRFVYALPWDERRVLVEDTRYSDSSAIDVPAFRAELSAWLSRRGWEVEAVEREEVAALPIPLDGQPASFTRPHLGVRGGFFHATTGYSLPFAARLAELLAAQPTLEPAATTALLNREARAHWEEMRFFRLLNRMLFRGAEPERRVAVFESFYRHQSELIARFYAGRLTFTDKLVALRRGAPTVPALRAMRAAFSTP